MKIKTNYPDALSSPDYYDPIGAKQDNHSNENYLADLARVAGKDKFSYLDLGCAGGQSVVDLHSRGHIACGVEGSDLNIMLNHSLNHVDKNWKLYKDICLFKADITKPFLLSNGIDNIAHKFDIVTAWDVLEHPKEDNIPAVLENIKLHLSETGKFICLINTTPGHHHQCVKPFSWWDRIFREHNFVSIGWDFNTSPRHLSNPLGDEDFGFILQLK